MESKIKEKQKKCMPVRAVAFIPDVEKAMGLSKDVTDQPAVCAAQLMRLRKPGGPHEYEQLHCANGRLVSQFACFFLKKNKNSVSLSSRCRAGQASTSFFADPGACVL